MYNCPITEGTEVFVLNQNKRIYKTKCDGYAINKNNLHILLLDEYDDMFTSWFPIEEFNKTFFLTYEDAEKATLIPSSEKIEFKPSDELQQPKWVNTSESLQNSILDKKDRKLVGPTAPSQGLFLHEVKFDGIRRAPQFFFEILDFFVKICSCL